MIHESQCTYGGCKRAWEHYVIFDDGDVDLLCEKHYKMLLRLEEGGFGAMVGFIGGMFGF